MLPNVKFELSARRVLFSVDGQIYSNVKDAFSEFDRFENMISLKISMAFLQDSGVQWVGQQARRHNLQPQQIMVFLSDAFSAQNPSRLLTELRDLATVFIVASPKLHAKLIYATDARQRSIALIGSANLTRSAMEYNLELVTVLHDPPVEKLNSFLFACEHYGYAVNDSMIGKYKEIEDRMSKQPKVGDRFEDLTRGIFTQSDPIPNSNELRQYFFTYEDYEVFFDRNITQNHHDINVRRDRIHDKLMRLHTLIKPIANALNLHEHKSTDHITSSVRPSEFTGKRLTWIGLRYGKHQNVVAKYTPQKMNPKDRLEYGFHKHACIQLSIHANGVSVSLFHAVRDSAWDRAYVHERLWGPTFRAEVIEELKKLKGRGYIWTIDNPFTGETKGDFPLDEREINTFFDFYSQDETGYESALERTWEHASPQIKTEVDLIALAREHLSLLEPLYRKLAQTS